MITNYSALAATLAEFALDIRQDNTGNQLHADAMSQAAAMLREQAGEPVARYAGVDMSRYTIEWLIEPDTTGMEFSEKVATLAFKERLPVGTLLYTAPPAQPGAVSVPRGWQLVPSEPTQEMYDAADRPQEMRLIWRAMLAAAPRQPEPIDPHHQCEAVELLVEWLHTELDSQDEEYQPWLDSFTARANAFTEGTSQSQPEAQPTETQVAAGAEVIANSPGIDAPKLPAECWMGLSRAVLAAAKLHAQPAEDEAVMRDAERHRFARTIFSIDDVTLALDSMRGFVATEEENTKYDGVIDAAIAREQEDKG